MNKPNNYTEYLVSAISDAEAVKFANENVVPEGAWFRLPSTLDDNAELFKLESTPILSREEWSSFKTEEYNKKRLVEQTFSRILFAKDFDSAAKYAAERNWWLHAWKFVADPELEEVLEYAFYC